ncbi:MAG TPA: 16S rRNA (guanine(966)-N(2))-methyltransferase RsmD [Candidatus Saccharibacteria bacterium]|nr:16S rRNA (guanine(966)-N(2))-methyltransferase RsmD [Candidatus Saccharibacteria bacterium]HRK94505.1 16S rRNA (guanine(966)-N(2))-methyltransferase RsmD [Candidatus Saccharibacteria bacterium]
MNVRIIAGEHGGRIIDAPGRSSTHAMSERARNAIFNSIGSEVEGATVLDLFAGSGSLALEALSRGADSATLIEKDRIAAKIIQKNIVMLGVEEKAKVIKATVFNWLQTTEAGPFDIIFADPPYHDTQFSTIAQAFRLLKPGALMVLSHPGKGEVPSKTGVVVVDNRSYGNMNLTFYRRDA